jgi:hypothetical protein
MLSVLRCLQKLGSIAILGLAFMFGQAFGQAAPPAAAATTPRVQRPPDPAMIAFAQQRGALLYRLDRAAWVATDVFRTTWRNRPGVALAGWVVEETEDSRLVTFYGKTTNELVAVARYGEQNGRIITRAPRLTGADATLSETQRGLVNTLERVQVFVRSPEAREQQIAPCTAAAFNTVVIPTPKADGSYEVYLMTAWVDRPVYPMGGHFRMLVPKDGPVIRDRAFTTGCLNIGAGQAGLQNEAMFVTHILDPQPTEIHVFAAQTLRLPLYVGIDDTVFAIQGAQIQQIEK